jgi:trans-aconitate methyltransferase
MTLKQSIIRQFKQPRGWPGRLAGYLMANRESNIERNKWVVGLLELKDVDYVLEVGYGPGLAIGYVAQQLTTGKIIGIDHSRIMFEQASRRNQADIATGKVKLVLGTVDDLTNAPQKFDRIFTSNVVQFWEQPVEVYSKLRTLLKDDGVIATQLMPRSGNADATDQLAENIAHWLRQAGLTQIRIEKKQFKQYSAVCVLAKS